MKNSVKLKKAFDFFKESYSLKMGGTQTVILPNGKFKHFDDREYYKGRGEKYNKSIKHDIKSDVKVTRKEYSYFLKTLKEREKLAKQISVNIKENNKRLSKLKEKGLYGIAQGDGYNYIELSHEECCSKSFDSERLAKTLEISIEDCDLLRSQGKTYVYAENKNGKMVNLYHSSLSCNNLSILFDIDNGEQYAEMNKNRERWLNAPYAGDLGQTAKENHFVC